MSVNPRGQSVHIDSSLSRDIIDNYEKLKARKEDTAFRDKQYEDNKAWRETALQVEKEKRDANNEWRNFQQTQVRNENAAISSHNQFSSDIFNSSGNSVQNLFTDGKLNPNNLISPITRGEVQNAFNTYAKGNPKAQIGQYWQTASQTNSEAILGQVRRLQQYYNTEVNEKGRNIKNVHKEFRNIPGFEEWRNSIVSHSNPAISEAAALIPYKPKEKKGGIFSFFSDDAASEKQTLSGAAPGVVLGGIGYAWGNKAVKSAEEAYSLAEKDVSSYEADRKAHNKKMAKFRKTEAKHINKDGSFNKAHKTHLDRLLKEQEALKDTKKTLSTNLKKAKDILNKTPKTAHWFKQNVKSLGLNWAIYEGLDVAGDAIFDDTKGGDALAKGYLGYEMSKMGGRGVKKFATWILPKLAKKSAMRVPAAVLLSAADGPLPFGELTSILLGAGLAIGDIYSLVKEYNETN